MRALQDDEKPLLQYLADTAGLLLNIDLVRVCPINDGGMGSLSIAPLSASRRFGASVAACEFDDADGVLVTAELYVDQYGAPFELDVFKVDFSALRSWPRPHHIRPAG